MHARVGTEAFAREDLENAYTCALTGALWRCAQHRRIHHQAPRITPGPKTGAHRGAKVSNQRYSKGPRDGWSCFDAWNQLSELLVVDSIGSEVNEVNLPGSALNSDSSARAKTRCKVAD
eukprot:54886-Pelagomonas_calceolata.AAC.2